MFQRRIFYPFLWRQKLHILDGKSGHFLGGCACSQTPRLCKSLIYSVSIIFRRTICKVAAWPTSSTCQDLTTLIRTSISCPLVISCSHIKLSKNIIWYKNKLCVHCIKLFALYILEEILFCMYMKLYLNCWCYFLIFFCFISSHCLRLWMIQSLYQTCLQ